MIHISAFALTGTADFSSIQTELKNLERTISNLRVPPIKTDVATPDFSKVVSAAKSAEKQATIKIKPEVDNSFGSGLSNVFSGQKGNFANVGKELGSSLTMGMQQQFGMMGGMASSVATALGPVGIAAGVAGAGIIALGAASVSTAKQWQSMMASISKTTGIEGAELDQLSTTLQNIRMQTGATAEAISGAVITAGSIGIPKEELAGFAQLALQMSSAFGMSSDSAAMAMGQIGNVAKPAEMSWTEFTTRAGSSVNVLADSMATSEEQILTGMKHLGATMGLLKPPVDTLDGWMALVATVQSLGLAGDSAGEAVQDAMQYATKDAKNAVSNLLGISAQELQLNLRTNAPEVLMDAAKAIAALPLDQQGAALAAFGQTGQKAISLLMGDLDGVTGQFTLMGKAIDSSSTAWSEGTSLSIAYAKSQETLDAALSKLSASLDVTGQKLGTVLLPMITSVVEALNAGVVAANEFASTTLPTWAQSATDWVNQTLGMEEDTPEQIAERKAKIARTAEKTTAKTLDTTGYQSFSEAQASAANLGKGTGNSYVDGLNAALDTGVPKALTDAYLGDALKSTKTAAASAGKQTAEEFVKTQDEYIKSHSSGSYTSETMQQMSAQQSVEYGPKYKYDYQQTLLDSVIYPLLDSYNIQKSARKTDVGGFLQIADSEGKIITSEQYTSDAEMNKLRKRLEDSVKPAFTDMPKYMRAAGDDISESFENILSDGVIAFEEKNELKDYLKSLETLETTYPIQFEATHLDDLKSKIEDAVAGTLITFDASEISLNFSRFISENAEMYNKIYQKTGVISYESNEKLLHDTLIAAPQEAQDLYAELQSAISSGDFKSLQMVPSIIQEIADVAPELLVLAGTTDRLNAAQEEWADGYRNLGKTTSEASENGDRMDGTFLRTSQTADIMSRGFVGMASAEYEQARAVKDVRNGMEKLYSPIIATENGLKELDKPLTGLATAGNALDAVFIDTTTCVGNANAAVTSFAAALNAASARISSLSTYETRSYAPTVVGTSYSSLNTYAMASAHAFDPIELLQAYTPNLLKLAEGGKVTKGGLAWVGETETEYVIPESKIKGLYPEFAKATKGSMQWSTGEKYFDDYPGARITAPTSYRWSSYPDAPQVQQLHTENMQTAWLSEGQTTGLDMISSEIRALQLASIGKSQVTPWFARGEIPQPKWWTAAATALSPQYAANWAANKGGTVPSVVEDVGTESASKLSGSSAWSSIYDNSGTCIAFVEPDPSLKFTPGKTKNTVLDRTAWNAIYDNSGTCIAFVEPDPSLKFTPALGSSAISSNEAVDILESIDDNTKNTKLSLDTQIDVLKTGIFATPGMTAGAKGTFETTGSDALVVGLSKEGYVVSYDPRTDTCEGMAFNAPDPSLKTTDKFYLGLTQNSPYRSEDKSPGYGWENIAQTDDENLQQLMKINEESQKTSESSEKTADNTQDVYKTLGQQYALQRQALSMSEASANALVTIASGGGGSGGLYGKTAGSFWGGLSKGGGGGWVGTGSTLPASLGGTGWGVQASNSVSGNAGTVSIGQGAMYYAEGGITNTPTAIISEYGQREAFVPISDRAAGLRILPQVMHELGVPMFAQGGIVGSGSSIIESFGAANITYAPTINANGLNKSEALALIEKSQDRFLAKVAKKQVLAKKRRG